VLGTQKLYSYKYSLIFGMPRKKKKKERMSIFSDLKDETKHGVLSIVFFAFAVLFVLAPFGKAGLVGEKIFNGLDLLLGFGYFILPLLSILLSIGFLRESRPNFALPKTIGAILFFLSSLGLIDLVGTGKAGFIGGIVAKPLTALFDTLLSGVILVAILIIALLIMFDARPTFRKPAFTLFKKKESDDDYEYEDNDTEDYDEDGGDYDEEEEGYEEGEQEDESDEEEPKQGKLRGLLSRKNSDEKEFIENTNYHASMPFTPPPLSILEGDKGKPGTGDIKANANIIKRTLQNFNISVEMDEISVGPSVTRYAIKPAEGVKLSRIVGLQSELALALAAHPVRIDAPIPGTSLVGIEVPNSTRTRVGLKSLFSSPDYINSPKPLLLGIGKSVSGQLHFTDLSKMPHLLIAGSTGSGKSIAIHTIINSLLFRSPPESLRFIMIDPKRVELTAYKDIPHLLTPVITDAKKAILALKWAAKEMDRRYDILESESCRDIDSYHKTVLGPAISEGQEPEEDDSAGMPERMPYIVIIIDELADIMSTYPRELESSIVRIAQLSRAVGIHLILSTQRPSVNVITGLIKANIPSRIALKVPSQIDSRTILDTGGAEKLLGAGDMLYLSGEMSKPVRLQSAFISAEEVNKVVKYLIKHYGGEDTDEINFSETTDKNTLFEKELYAEDDDEDDLYEDARLTVIEAGKASTSYIQRKLKVGYARAARLIDMLEDRGVVGPQDGSKPREILDDADEEGYGDEYDGEDEDER